MYLSELFLIKVGNDFSDKSVKNAVLECVREGCSRDVGSQEMRDLFDVCREFMDQQMADFGLHKYYLTL